jgi:hypothetical protein
MDTCKISVYLAYAMAIYCIASIFYLIATRSVGTPFKDSLSEKQLKIKHESANVRRTIFYSGIAIGAISMVIFRPFSRC